MEKSIVIKYGTDEIMTVTDKSYEILTETNDLRNEEKDMVEMFNNNYVNIAQKQQVRVMYSIGLKLIKVSCCLAKFWWPQALW